MAAARRQRALVKGATPRAVKIVRIPSSDPMTIAASIAADPAVVGAFVVVLGADGSLRLGLSGDMEEKVTRPLLEIVEVVRVHCDARHQAEGGLEVGFTSPGDN